MSVTPPPSDETPKPGDAPGHDDPVLAKRARIAWLVTIGMRVGYSLFGVAVVLFFVGLFGNFPSWVATGIVICLVVGSLALAPAIVFGYAVKAAIRDDREHGRLP